MSLDKSSAGENVSTLALEMRRSITALAGDRAWHENRKSWLARASRNAGISYRTARALFYQEQADPRASVVERVRAAVRRRQLAQEEAGRGEARLAIERLVALRAALAQIDEDFHRETIARIDDALRAMGGQVGARTVPNTGGGEP